MGPKQEAQRVEKWNEAWSKEASFYDIEMKTYVENINSMGELEINRRHVSQRTVVSIDMDPYSWIPLIRLPISIDRFKILKHLTLGDNPVLLSKTKIDNGIHIKQTAGTIQ